jgi:hypothetical protein
MTEQEWRVCADPKEMLEFLGRKASERLLRLFGCACCRRIWHLITDKQRRNALEAAEGYADGIVTSDELQQALSSAMGVYQGGGVSLVDGAILVACHFHPWDELAIANTISLLESAASAAAGGPPWDDAWMQARIPELKQQAGLLRDIFGRIFYTKTLFRPTLLDPNWLTSTVISLANQMYDSKNFVPMPILGDALQDAGCDEADILDHCRQSGVHVRGCWVVDLLLQKL